MRTWKSLLLILFVAVAAWAPATASAAFQHVVSHGESLSSVAAADGLSVSQLAAANGMSPDAQLAAGSALVIPPQDAAATPTAAPPSEGASAAPASVAPGSAASSATGGYVVQPGDTLSAIAARLGVSVDALASANGMDASDVLVSGRTLEVSGATAAPSSSGTAEMVSTAPATGSDAQSTGSGAQPTGETVSASEVASIAGNEGVSPSLAEAVGYQESGFNNGKVSATGATGVMQIMPSTWSYIGQHLAGPPPLSPTSAADNIRAGSLLLHSLLDATGGDTAMAVAGYYQGLQSVRQHGLFADTQAYVNNVMALRQRFGGG